MKSFKRPKTIPLQDVIHEMEKDPLQKARMAYYQRAYDTALVMRKARKDSGLSKGELSAKSGVPKSTITRVESGMRNFSVQILIKLLGAMGKELKIEIVSPANI
jgi:ribosome-binding protein aMBF1 (putative translation factor)